MMQRLVDRPVRSSRRWLVTDEGAEILTIP
jgi:hypothetical protein